MKLQYFLVPVILLLLAGLFFTPLVQLPYIVRSSGVVYPVQEWQLAKADEGLLSYKLTDHFNNTISHYSITEFQRGDHGEFVLHPGVFAGGRIYKGDTIGMIRSNEEQRRLIQLEGELESRRRQLEVYRTGARPEEVAVARERLLLAEREYETQRQLMARSEALFEQEVIPPQEFELARNEYEIRRMAVQIARSEYEALRAGAKPEQLELARAEVRALEAQIAQLSGRLDAFTILAPFSGFVMRDRPGVDQLETILRIADDSQFIVVVPVEVHQLAYITPGQRVRLVPENRAQAVEATVVATGNAVQMINRRQNVFVTCVLDEHLPHILPQMMIQTEIDAGRITLMEYARRITRTIYAN
jgi:multidrug resistance efflux pump